jgi:hypothetical protein
MTWQTLFAVLVLVWALWVTDDRLRDARGDLRELTEATCEHFTTAHSGERPYSKMITLCRGRKA